MYQQCILEIHHLVSYLLLSYTEYLYLSLMQTKTLELLSPVLDSTWQKITWKMFLTMSTEEYMLILTTLMTKVHQKTAIAHPKPYYPEHNRKPLSKP